MKVVMVTPYPPKPDGIGEHTRALVGALDALDDVDVDVLTLRRPAPEESAPNVHRLLSVRPRSIRASLGMVRHSRPDVIHYQFAIPAFGFSGIGAVLAGVRTRREFGTPIVITLHEARRELDLLRGVGRLVYRLLVSVADVVVVHTTEARDLVVDVCGADPRAVVLTALGASPPADELLAPSVLHDVRTRYDLGDRPLALCFGYLHPDKGIEHLIEAADTLRSRGRSGAAGIDVLIAGAVRPRTGVFRFFERADRDYEADLHRAVERSGLSDLVRFIGFVPSADVPALFSLARAVVMPCTKVTQSSVLASATAAGTPVVASDLPGLREALGDGGVLVAPGDPHALADALEAVMFDDLLADDLGERQLLRRASIGLASVAATLRGVYMDLGTGTPIADPVAHGLAVDRG